MASRKKSGDSYEPPLICGLLYGGGLFFFVVAFLASLGEVIASRNEPSSFLLAAAYGVGACVTGLILVAASKALHFLAYTAHNVGLLVEQKSSPGAGKLQATSAIRAAPNARHFARTPRFYYQAGGATLGPVDQTELQRLVNDGTVNHDTYIRSESEEEWSRLEEMVG